MSNAHEHAYFALTAAAAKIKGPGVPEIADFKDARDLAKSAHETLDASYKLLSKGILHVVDGNDERPTPLFNPDGDPAPGAEVSEDDLAPEPEGGEAPPLVPEPLPSLGCSSESVQDAEIVPNDEAGEEVDGENPGEDPNGEPQGGEPEDHPSPDSEADLEAARAIGRERKRLTCRILRDTMGIGYPKARRLSDALIAEGFMNEAGEVAE